MSPRRTTFLTGFGKKLGWAFLLGTFLVLVFPVSEADTGKEPVHVDINKVKQEPPSNERFVKYLKSNGYTIIEDRLPLYIEVSIQQTDKNPNVAVRELADAGCKLTGKSVKVILHTFGGKYIAQGCD